MTVDEVNALARRASEEEAEYATLVFNTKVRLQLNCLRTVAILGIVAAVVGYAWALIAHGQTSGATPWLLLIFPGLFLAIGAIGASICYTIEHLFARSDKVEGWLGRKLRAANRKRELRAGQADRRRVIELATQLKDPDFRTEYIAQFAGRDTSLTAKIAALADDQRLAERNMCAQMNKGLY